MSETPARGDGDTGASEIDEALERIELPEGFDRAPLRRALETAPVPAHATRLAEQLLATPREAGGPSLGAQVPAHSGEKLARIIYAVCGVAPFLAKLFQRHPGWLEELLADDLEAPRERADLDRRLASALAGDTDPAIALRRFKYYELARLTIRDACEAWVPLDDCGVILTEISNLADVILARALEVVQEQACESVGPARWRTRAGDEVELAFCVLGLGKLGSGELNYSSDVDIVYVHETPEGPLAPPADDAASGLATLAPQDYFARIAQRFGRLVADTGEDRFLYRVDLDLRPLGSQGSLVVSDQALGAYYESWADTWERAAFMKARPVAGDERFGWDVVRRVDPMVYRASMDFAGAESIRAMKEKVEEKHGGNEETFNVKIDSGGIRDVEFIAQSQQLLHGARIPQIRGRSTQQALRDLAEVELLPADRVETLLDAYRFLRRTENRLQMEDERQHHTAALRGEHALRLARAMGFVSDDALARFREALESRREAIRWLFADAYAEGGKARILALFARNVPHFAQFETTRSMVESLAEKLAFRIDEAPDPGLALNNLDRFLQSVGSRSFYYELLIDRPELVPRITALFASSNYLSQFLARHPRLIERLFADPDVLLLSREKLRAELEVTRGSFADDTRDPTELTLDVIRVFQHCQVLNVGLLDVAGVIPRAEAETALAEIAEVCLDEALELARRRMAERRGGVPDAARDGVFLVVGMGKLGTHELTYGSDLDLIFLYDLPPGASGAQRAEAQAYFVTLTQRLISHIQTPTTEGACYEIDARLRPSGNQGALVTSLEAFRRYHATSAVWERQALLRARPVAGDAALADVFRRVRRDILDEPLPGDLASEVGAVRQRMENELASETDARRNFKTGRGGLVDVESVVQFLQLGHGGAHPALFEAARTEQHLATLATLGLLSAADAETLREGWEFLQHLSSRLRIVENRSITDLDAERADLEGLARRLGYGGSGRERGARRALLADYERHTEAIRRVYEAILPPEGSL